MKKLILSAFSLFSATALFAQPILNAGMEAWRGGSTGIFPHTVPVAAPTEWFGLDSLVIGYAQFAGLAGLITVGSDFHQQVFQESTIVHSGSSSAKIVTAKQDTLGMIPGMLSNAKIDVDVATLMAGGDPMDAFIFSGGTNLTLRPSTVSAWVSYLPGIDTSTGMMGGADEGVMTVQVIATISGFDSVVGVGFVNITPSTSFVEVTAPVTYTTTAYDVSNLRIIFVSSGGSGAGLENSTLYVDDVSMVGVPQSVGQVSSGSELFHIFPNPAENIVNVTGSNGEGYSFVLYDISGKKVAEQILSDTNQLDVSAQASGVYFYSIIDSDGVIAQRGKLSLTN